MKVDCAETGKPRSASLAAPSTLSGRLIRPSDGGGVAEKGIRPLFRPVELATPPFE